MAGEPDIPGIPMVDEPKRHFCPNCNKNFDTVLHRPQDAINLGAWAFIQTFLKLSPYIQMRIHSYREVGLDRRWAINMINEKNQVIVSAAAATMSEAADALLQAIKEKMVAEKENGG